MNLRYEYNNVINGTINWTVLEPGSPSNMGLVVYDDELSIYSSDQPGLSTRVRTQFHEDRR